MSCFSCETSMCRWVRPKIVTRALAIAGATVACAAPASAATVQVETKKDEFGPGGTNKCALREAVQAANTNAKFGGCSKGSGADRVVLRRGNYNLSLPGTSEDANADGDIDIDAGLRIIGKGAGKTTIDGNGRIVRESIFDVNGGGARFEGIKMRDGRDDDDEYGGAIDHGSPGNLTLQGVRFVHNVADYYGGAVYVDNDDANVKIAKSAFLENRSAYYGGGFYADDANDVAMTKVLFEGNSADDGYGGGAAVYDAEGKTTIKRGRFVDNTSDEYYGGGLYLDSAGGAVIDESTFHGNESGVYDDGYGGGIYTYDTASVLRNSTVSRNRSSDDGGGIYVDSGSMNIVNSTISGNHASYNSGYGGGIYASGDVRLKSSTVVLNRGYNGAALYESGDVEYKNSLIAWNHYLYDGDTYDCYSPASDASLGHNFFGDDTCDTDGPGDIEGGTTSAPLDPKLGPLASNGGPTRTHALIKGSPAINKGQGCPNRDQRGKKRKGRCDIGAFER